MGVVGGTHRVVMGIPLCGARGRERFQNTHRKSTFVRRPKADLYNSWWECRGGAPNIKYQLLAGWLGWGLGVNSGTTK